MKAEVGVYYEAEPQVAGTASADVDDDHPSHAYLYLPDLSSQTGWAAHQVPERRDRGEPRTPVGFGKPGGR